MDEIGKPIVGPDGWAKSSRSGNNGQCVEVKYLDAVDPGDDDAADDETTE